MPIGTFYATEILVGLTDLAVVGALGTTQLAAVGLAKTALFSVMVVGFAVLSIGTVLMAERPKSARRGAVVIASTMVAVPFVALALSIGNSASKVLAIGGYDAGLIQAFSSYASILAWALAPALLFAILKNVLNAVQRTSPIIWLSLGIVLGNLAASIILVHGVGSWQGLGVSGAAWATLGVNTGAALVLLVHVLRSGNLQFRGIRLTLVSRLVTVIIRLGWAAGAQQALESALFVVVLFLLGLHSTAWLAAGTVVFAIMELNYAASGALGEVLAARIAAARASGQASLTSFLRLGGCLSGAVAACLPLLVGFFAETTVAIFSSAQTEPAVQTLMVDLLRWTAPIFIFDAWQIVYMHALRGMRRTVLPMVLSTGCYWVVGLGGGLFLAGPANFEAPGVWIGFCMGLACAAALLCSMAFQAARRPKR